MSDSSKLRISAIVPVLDEARRIREQVLHLLSLGLHEVIVVDGGSTDGTLALVDTIVGVTAISTAPGRARQMNAGAKVATGDVLIFVHSDVRLPEDAVEWIQRVLADDATVAGAFRTWTVADTGRWWPGPLLHLADVRSRYTRHPYGDQALFVRAEVFRKISGFPEQPLMEDLELSRRLSSVGRIGRAGACVRVSGRRFERRPFIYTFFVNVFPLLYDLGVSPRTLAAIYRDVR